MFSKRIDMQDKHTILLVLKSGGDFNLLDVELLAGKLKKLCDPVQIICLCDRVAPVTFQDFTIIQMEHNWSGWWSKMNLFSPALEHLRPFLYLDLDTAVIKSFDWPEYQGFIMLRDFYKTKSAASGMMWIPARNDKISKIWNEWIKYSDQWMRKCRGDQNFISLITDPDCFWQDIAEGIVSFKPNSHWRKELDGTERIICFHGKPRIPVAAKTVEWVKNYVEHVTENHI